MCTLLANLAFSNCEQAVVLLFSSAQFKMVSVHLGKPICAPPCLSSFLNVAFEMVPIFIRLMVALSHPFMEDHWVLPLSMPLSSRWSMVWCPELSSPQLVSQAPQHLRSLRQATCDGCFACQTVCLCHFPSLWHVQGSTSIGVFKLFYRKNETLWKGRWRI